MFRSASTRALVGLISDGPPWRLAVGLVEDDPPNPDDCVEHPHLLQPTSFNGSV
jgi:hypothetical protein